MSPYMLTTKSLITDSKIVLCAMFAFAVVGFGFICFGIPLPFILFLATSLAGIGYTTRKYFLSERRRLVPGMNEACAKVAICSLLACSLISTVLIAIFHGFIPELVGGCVLALAFSLWVGCIEKIALPMLGVLYAAPFLMWAFEENTLRQIGRDYLALPLIVHAGVGFLMCLLGVGFVFRFHHITTSKYSPILKKAAGLPEFVFGRIKLSTCINVIWFLVFATGLVLFLPTLRTAELSTEGTFYEGTFVAAEVLTYTAVSFLLCFGLFFAWRQLLQYFFPVDQKMVDVSHLLYGKVDSTGWRTFLRIYGLGLVFVLLIVRGYVSTRATESLEGVLGMGLVFLPFVAATLLLYGIPIHFSRLWVSGASETRFETALTILLLVTRRSLVFAMLVLSVLLAYAMVVTHDVTLALFTSMLVIGFSALPVLVIARFYPFIAKHESFTIISFLSIGVTFVVLTVSNIEFAIVGIQSVLDAVGAIPCIAMATIAATGCWFVCLYAAARSLADSKGLMECQSMLFAPEV